MVNPNPLKPGKDQPTSQALVLNCHLSAISLPRVAKFPVHTPVNKAVPWYTSKATVRLVSMANTLLHILHMANRVRSISSVSHRRALQLQVDDWD